ncbi:ABC transporter substrate-binding protein [Phytoactinopolyspora endophytica]|uniref:ABC transporter substrate-binding protein n=1 Tax=Phytoactinopolyspora endophytica TaxID=1642495 RepID=UPI00101D49B7|nr:extracellular solute-binding protein [Phytoactinopolyspora endophytica]
MNRSSNRLFTAGGNGRVSAGPSRRDFLRTTGILGAAGLSGILASCGGDDPPSSEGNASSPSSGGGQGGGTVRVWTVPTGPEDEQFQRAQFDQFAQDNPDVEVELQFFPPDQYANAMQLAFTGGQDTPDVFRQSSGQGLDLRGAHGRGWVRPITEFLTDDFTARFPDYVYDPDRSPLYIDDEAWGVPNADPAVNGSRLLYYNIDVLGEFGFDAPPSTWSEMREMAAKITTDGGGRVYGTAPVGGALKTAMILQNLAGPQPYRSDAEPPISLLTGEPAMSESSMVEMVELLQSMNSDEIFTPGWETWDPTQVLQQMAAGRLGMYIFPVFHAAELRKANADLNLGIASPPVPDSGRAGSRAPANGVMAWWMMSSEARSPEAAWRVLDFFGSVDFQRAAFEDQGQISIMPGVYEGIEVDEDTTRIREVAAEVVRNRPEPTDVDPAVEEFYENLVSNGPRPNPLERITEAITRGTDFRAAAEAYDEELAETIEAELERSDLGTMDAFVFPDWDPLEEYSAS